MSAPPIAPNGRARPQPSAIGFASLWRAVRRYSLLAVVIVLLAGGIGAAVWFFLPLPKNTGRVVFEVKAAIPSVLGYTVVPTDRSDFMLFRQFQVASITSTSVVTAALADPTVANLPMLDREKTGGNPVGWVQGSLRVDFTAGPELMRVSLEGDNPDELAAVLKAVSLAYMKGVVNKDKAARSARMETLKKAQEKYMDKIRENRKRIAATLSALGMGSGDPLSMQMKERLLQMQMTSAEGDLNRVYQSQRETAIEKVLAEKGGGPQKIPDELMAELIENHPEYLALQSQHTELSAKLAATTKALQPGVRTPGLIQLEAALAQVDKDLVDAPAKLRAGLAEKLSGRAARADKVRAEGLQAKIRMLSESERQTFQAIERLANDKRAMINATHEIEQLRAEMTHEEAMAAKLTDDIENIKPELDAPSRVNLWEEPTASPGVEGNRRMKYTAMTAGGVLLAGLVLLQWLEFRNRRVQHIEELTNGLGLAVIGTVPLIPRAAGADRAAWTNRLAEAVNATRSLLLAERRHAPTGTPARTLLVTSATSGEGKTSLTTHLAVSLAGAGRKVLLIDSDMRRPAAHRVLGLEAAPGLSDYLSTDADPDALIKLCRVPGLHVLTAGRWRPEAVAGLAGDRWSRLLDRVVREYDFVLIDSPPVLPVADALSIAKGVDGVVMSVMQDKSRYAAVRTAYDRLSLVGATVIGAVVNGVPNNASYYYYYYDDRYNRPDGVGRSPADDAQAANTPA